DEVSKEVDAVNVGKVDIEEHQDLATQHGVRSIPTFTIVRDGEEVARKMGAMDKSEFVDWVESNA
ncbi:MAG: thioredoxin family protein, partial [Candidatus Nanohaloarchaea archaeon]